MKRHNIRRLAVFILTAAALVGYVSAAFAWWDSKWSNRRKITFNTSSTGANIAETLTDFPVLVRLHTGNFNFSTAKPDGSDIRFVGADDKTPLKFHKELFDPQLEIGLFWVKVPRIAGSSNADIVWVYSGNKTVAAGEERGGTYDVNTALVYHFDEPDGAPKDATAYGNHASRFDGGSRNQSIIGSGAVFDGSGAKIVVPRSPAMNFSGGMTCSAWIKLSGPQSDGYLLSWEDGARKIVFGIDQSSTYCRVATGEKTFETSKGGSIPPDSWHHVAFTIKPSEKISVFVDGSEVSSTAFTTAIPELSTDLAIGGSLANGHAFTGELDEVRMAKIALGPGWIRAAYVGEGPEATLYAVADEEAGEGGSADNSYLSTIVKNLTADGWAVIGCLIVFGSLSTFVFVKKTLMVLVNQKTNDAFLDVFKDTTDLLSLDSTEVAEDEDEDEFYGSSIYQVYLEGARELKKWLGKGFAGDGKHLSALGMRSFSASLERAFIRENKKLNSLMVILSMAIAGAPFLGLLGTVWGVMNTFAAMAEAGEANITAIAPGIASALAATVTGLLVAIPSLFAYNYLITQIKIITADVSLFIDEFSMKVEGDFGGGK